MLNILWHFRCSCQCSLFFFSLYKVLPVIEPELLEFPEPTSIQVGEGENINLTCTVQAGVNAKVWWTESGGVPVQSEAQVNSSLPAIGPMVYVNTTANKTEQYVVQYSSVLYLHDFSSELAGVYVCIVDDPGYPGNNVHEEYEVAVRLLPTPSVQPTTECTFACMNSVPMVRYLLLCFNFFVP